MYEENMKETLIEIFKKLNNLIEAENLQRKAEGIRLIPRAKITILGQTSLLAQPELTYMLCLVQTGDLDAKLIAEYAVKKNLIQLLPEYGMIYDDDSHLIFIPKGSTYSAFIDLPLLNVDAIDPESALVSKAVKAPSKNVQLIRAAIASGQFPTLPERIIENGGDLKNFI